MSDTSSNNGPTPMDIDSNDDPSEHTATKVACQPPPKQSRKRTMEAMDTDEPDAHVAKKRRTHAKTPTRTTEEKQLTSLPPHFSVKFEEYSQKIRELFASFPDLMKLNPPEEVDHIQQQLIALMHAIDSAPLLAVKDAFINRPEVVLTGKYDELFVYLLQNSSETLSEACQRISSLLCDTYKSERKEPVDVEMENHEELKQETATESDEKTPDAVSQFNMRIQSLEQDIREVIMATADRKAYGAKPRNKKSSYFDDPCPNFDRAAIPSLSWKDCRLWVWESRNMELLPQDCRNEIKSALTQMKQLSAKIGKYRDYVSKYETALRPSKDSSEKKITRLQQSLDSIAAWEVQQKQKKQKELQKQQRKRQLQEEKAEKSRKAKLEKAEKKRKAQEAKATPKKKKKVELSEEEIRLQQEKQRQKEEQERLRREKEARKERQSEKFCAFFKTRPKKNESLSVSASESSNDSAPVSYYRTKFKPFEKRQGWSYGEVQPISRTFEMDSLGRDNDMDPGVCLKRILTEIRSRRGRLPRASIMPKVSKSECSRLKNTRRIVETDEDGKEREPLIVEGNSGNPIILDGVPMELDETGTHPTNLMTVSFRSYQEDYRPSWCGLKEQKLPSKRPARNPLYKFQSRSYDSDDSGIEWYGDQESDGESIGDEEDRSDDESERNNLREDGFEQDEFLVSAEDPDFGDKEFFERKKTRGKNKSRFPIDFGSRVRGDDSDSPIVIPAPRFLPTLVNTQDPRDRTLYMMATSRSYLMQQELWVAEENDKENRATEMNVDRKSSENEPVNEDEDVEMTDVAPRKEKKAEGEIVTSSQRPRKKKAKKITPVSVPMDTEN